MEQLALAEPHHKQVSEFVHTQDLYNTFPCRSVLRNEQRSTQRLRRAFICIPCCPETLRTPTISDTPQWTISRWQHATTGPASEHSHSKGINRINILHFHIHTFMPWFRFRTARAPVLHNVCENHLSLWNHARIIEHIVLTPAAHRP